MKRNMFVIGCTTLLLFGTGCQPAPQAIVTPAPTPVKPQGIPTPEGVTVTPYEHPEIQRQTVPTTK